jgi:DNA-directed RNA polymerase specialized sigma24 family protein
LAARRETIYYQYAEEYLRDYHQLKTSIGVNQKRIKAVLDTLFPSCVGNYELDAGGHSSEVSDSTLRWVINREQASKYNPEIRECEKQIEEAKIILGAIDGAVARLSEMQRELISKRFFEEKSWVQVAGEVNLSVNRCLEWKKRAVKKIAIALYGPRAIGIHGIGKNGAIR